MMNATEEGTSMKIIGVSIKKWHGRWSVEITRPLPCLRVDNVKVECSAFDTFDQALGYVSALSGQGFDVDMPGTKADHYTSPLNSCSCEACRKATE